MTCPNSAICRIKRWIFYLLVGWSALLLAALLLLQRAEGGIERFTGARNVDKHLAAIEEMGFDLGGGNAATKMQRVAEILSEQQHRPVCDVGQLNHSQITTLAKLTFFAILFVVIVSGFHVMDLTKKSCRAIPQYFARQEALLKECIAALVEEKKKSPRDGSCSDAVVPSPDEDALAVGGGSTRSSISAQTLDLDRWLVGTRERSNCK